MAIEKVREYFRQFGIENRMQEFEVSSATVELAAAALGCEPYRIAKTLSFMTEEGPILIVAAGDAKIDNPKYKAQFHTKAKNASTVEYKAATGFEAVFGYLFLKGDTDRILELAELAVDGGLLTRN